MRLQLIACGAAVVCGGVGIARADNRAGSWVSIYTDDDGLTVISPQLSMRADPRDDVEVEAAYDVDVISAASVDVVSAASPRGYDEVRHGMIVGASWLPAPGSRVAVRYLPSWERDYRSHGVAATAAREWVDRRLTTRIDVRVNVDDVGRAGDDRSRWRSLVTTAAGAGVGWVVSPRTVAQASYELQASRGFHASPYRYVDIAWSDDAMVTVPEALPDERTRHAIAVGVRHELAPRWFGAVDYRVYVDSWGVVSHTGDVEVQRALWADRVIVGVHGRAYRQGVADVYQPVYRVDLGRVPAYRTSDKMLAAGWSVLGAARADVALTTFDRVGELRAVGKLELYDQRFDDVPRLARRRALVTSLGLSMEF